MGPASSTKWAGVRKTVMTSGPLWWWPTCPNTLSLARQPLSHTWSKFKPWTTWGLLRSQLQSWAILEKIVSVPALSILHLPEGQTYWGANWGCSRGSHASKGKEVATIWLISLPLYSLLCDSDSGLGEWLHRRALSLHMEGSGFQTQNLWMRGLEVHNIFF